MYLDSAPLLLLSTLVLTTITVNNYHVVDIMCRAAPKGGHCAVNLTPLESYTWGVPQYPTGPSAHGKLNRSDHVLFLLKQNRLPE